MGWAAAIDKQTDVRLTDTDDHDTFVIVTKCDSVLNSLLSSAETFNISVFQYIQSISQSISRLSV